MIKKESDSSSEYIDSGVATDYPYGERETIIEGREHQDDNADVFALAMENDATSSSQSTRMIPLLWYIGFGILHEFVHLTTYALLIGTNPIPSYNEIIKVLLRAVFGQYCAFPLTNSGTDIMFWVRHTGWIFSLASAVLIHYFIICKNKKTGANGRNYQGSRHVIFAAYLTALDAIATDLFGMTNDYASRSNTILFCGNFGLILINSQWINDDGGKTALNVLEKMIKITMMRGAQTGGVATFMEDKESMKGNIIRVVNTKRGDLSQRIRMKLQKDVCDWSGKLIPYTRGKVQGFFGHTRFATSSMATMDGCHPHRWSSRRLHRIYYPFPVIRVADSECNSNTSDVSDFCDIYVENYITHNGDFDFFDLNGKSYGLHAIQDWLEYATCNKKPSSVDSVAVAGLVDLLRTQGCFPLSVRYALCLGLPICNMNLDRAKVLPSLKQYNVIGATFEDTLQQMLTESKYTFEQLSLSSVAREVLVEAVISNFNSTKDTNPNIPVLDCLDDEEQSGITPFVRVTIDAFFDNDLLMATKLFLASAKGSFGVCIMSSLDARRQVCLGARGQTLSVAFYPKRGIICYGSEQAAVKAAALYNTPGSEQATVNAAALYNTPGNEENDSHESALRIDLDDLSGELCLLDWGDHNGSMSPAVSLPNRHTVVHRLMNGKVNMLLLKNIHSSCSSNEDMEEGYDPMQIKTFKPESEFSKRMISLEDADLVRPLPPDTNDPVLQDIRDIPKICEGIQSGWQTKSLNRLTAFNLQKCVEKHIDSIINDHDHKRNVCTIDILLTGCEVSLWVAEQFASDLQKAFPLLNVKAISSNKLLGLFGQEMDLPTTGFNLSSKTLDLHNPICIIVSHSGETFAPLACSNLLQGVTRDIFVVTSEWDTQIGKQLRMLYDSDDIISSRIFSTGCGTRAAEPCSLTVAATHQLLTQIYGIICLAILKNIKFREASGAIITEEDLEILEKCNCSNITALEDIVGTLSDGTLRDKEFTKTERDLRRQGKIWANHVLENVKAYIMTIAYVLITVISGNSIFAAFYRISGIDVEGLFWLSRVLDAMIYIFLPQINVIIIRLVERRNLRHRMTSRSIVIGDIPWVSQATEAYLSKLFACSYSIAGISVMSGNPVDHLVHRQTHRIVRGTLLVCGRPDGRLSALTSTEVSVALAISQASSIQSLGGTCESITIGHNPYKLPLSTNGIFLKTFRPYFLCEQVLREKIGKRVGNAGEMVLSLNVSSHSVQRVVTNTANYDSLLENYVEISHHSRGGSSRGGSSRGGSSRGGLTEQDTNYGSLLASYVAMKHSCHGTKDILKVVDTGRECVNDSRGAIFDNVLTRLIGDKEKTQLLKTVFDEVDEKGNGSINGNELLLAFKKLDLLHYTDVQVHEMFDLIVDEKEGMCFDDFIQLESMPAESKLRLLQAPTQKLNANGLAQIQPSKEIYFGYKMRMACPDKVHDFVLVKTQSFVMELYESRIASMQRFVAMTVMFHEMAKSVENFFDKISFGLLSYRMDRTHSIMRVATTASPVCAHEVSKKMEDLLAQKQIRHSIATIERFWQTWKTSRS